MKLLLRAVCLATILAASPALAQMPAAPMVMRASDTPQYKAAAAASERAVAICNGLWSGNQTMAQMDEHILTPAGDLQTDVTVEHLLHMSSGLYAEGGGSPRPTATTRAAPSPSWRRPTSSTPS